jgi:hypothetical protein
VGRRALPVFLVAAAQIADWLGAHGLARNALLAALPFAAVAALVVFGEYVDARGKNHLGLQALCSGAIVAFLVLSCAVRSNAVHGVPPLGASSLAAVLVLFGVKGALAAGPFARRLEALSPAKP